MEGLSALAADSRTVQIDTLTNIASSSKAPGTLAQYSRWFNEYNRWLQEHPCLRRDADERWLAEVRPRGFVFGSRSGEKVKSGSWAAWFRAAASEIDPCLTLHSLRGGGATSAIKNGVPRSEVMAQGRWKSESAFTAYVEPTLLSGL